MQRGQAHSSSKNEMDSMDNLLPQSSIGQLNSLFRCLNWEGNTLEDLMTPSKAVRESFSVDLGTFCVSFQSG